MHMNDLVGEDFFSGAIGCEIGLNT